MPKQNHFIFNIIPTRDELKTALDGAILHYEIDTNVPKAINVG